MVVPSTRFPVWNHGNTRGIILARPQLDRHGCCIQFGVDNSHILLGLNGHFSFADIACAGLVSRGICSRCRVFACHSWLRHADATRMVGGCRFANTVGHVRVADRPPIPCVARDDRRRSSARVDSGWVRPLRVCGKSGRCRAGDLDHGSNGWLGC